MEAALVPWLLGTSTQTVFSYEFFPWIFFLRVMCPCGLVPPLVGRAASGRALAPEPPRATRSQTEPRRTAADNGLFLFLQFPFLWFFSSLFFRPKRLGSRSSDPWCSSNIFHKFLPNPPQHPILTYPDSRHWPVRTARGSEQASLRNLGDDKFVCCG